MSHKDTLRLLFPIDLDGHLPDLEIDGKHLDIAEASAESLLREMFGDSALMLLSDWERVYGISPAADATIQQRRQAVVSAIRRRSGLSIPYFVSLAAGMGLEIEIFEPIPGMADWLAAGDELFGPEVIWQWGVILPPVPVIHFRAGESAAGEPLATFTGFDALERLFQELKPAHTYVYFIYDEAA